MKDGEREVQESYMYGDPLYAAMRRQAKKKQNSAMRVAYEKAKREAERLFEEEKN